MSTPASPILPCAEATAFGRAILPPGQRLRGIRPEDMAGVYGFLHTESPALPAVLDRACRVLDGLAVAYTGRRFVRLAPERQQELLRTWLYAGGTTASALSALSAIFKLYYFDRAEIHDLFGVSHSKAPAIPEPLPRYIEQQSAAGYDLPDEELEADVLVVGSGAAGALVAKELSQRGHAVLLVEAGRYFRRNDFDGRYLPAARTFYHWRPRNYVAGNCLIFLPTGRTVGGSTTINTATCFRPPSWVHREWVRKGLTMLSQERMAPYFDDVEAVMRVEPAPRRLWGRQVEIMSALFDELGLSHGVIRRNAPDCDGQNACDFGCPSGGKYSQDLACVPLALRNGAMLLTETELTEIHLRHRQVRGATLVSGGRRIRVRTPEVVLCCGTLSTPDILWRHELGGPQVGRNLTIQPSCSVSARLSEEVFGFGQVIPSTHYVDEFQDRGLMLISANMPLDFGAMPLQAVGRDLMREMESYQHYGTWGALIAETARGRMVRAPGGEVMTLYNMTPRDVELLHFGMAYNCELYLKAGATACHPSVVGWRPIENMKDLERFRRARLRPRNLLMTAYHPLGTCRMGVDPSTSVVDPDYRVRGVRGLHVVDGSVVPGPLGINSQLTVMAFARRGADIVHEELSG